jgi:hypothetical protein
MREPGLKKGISRRESEGRFIWCHSVFARWLDFAVGWIPMHHPSHSLVQDSRNTTIDGVQRCTRFMLQKDLSTTGLSSPVDGDWSRRDAFDSRRDLLTSSLLRPY